MEWRRHPIYAAYEVSDHGEVRRATASRGTHAGKMLKASPTPQGYRCASLSIDGVVTRRFLHILVLETFKGSMP